MGLFRKSCYTNPSPAAQQPNPRNFKIVRTKDVGKHLVALIEYPGCTNYEGVKLMIWQHRNAAWLAQRTEIDPHFAGSADAPFIRLRPTCWALAIAIAEGMFE